jgi:hypothetical protein
MSTSTAHRRPSLRPRERAKVKDAGRGSTPAHIALRELGHRLRTPRLALSCAALALLLTLFPAVSARAAYDPVGSGQTTLKLAPSFTGLLHRSGVKLEGKGGVTVRGGAISFPLSGGKLEPVEAKGTIEHAGQLVFRSGSRKLPLRSLQLKTTRATSPFAAKLGGGQLKLSTGAKLASERSGFGTGFQTTGMRLSAKAATRLEKKLGLRGVFKAGQQFASATTVVEPATVGLTASGKAELTIDPGFAAKLGSFFVAVNPIFPSEHPGAFTFAIGGGVLAPDGSSGLVKTNGGIEFIQVGGGQFFIRNPELEIATGQALAEYQLVLASTGAGPNAAGPILGLGAGVFSAEPAARTITDSGASLSLSATVAQAFNEAFATPLGRPGSFAAGETLGTISFLAQAQ